MNLATLLVTLSLAVGSVVAAPAESFNGGLTSRQDSGCYPLFVKSAPTLSIFTILTHVKEKIQIVVSVMPHASVLMVCALL